MLGRFFFACKFNVVTVKVRSRVLDESRNRRKQRSAFAFARKARGTISASVVRFILRENLVAARKRLHKTDSEFVRFGATQRKQHLLEILWRNFFNQEFAELTRFGKGMARGDVSQAFHLLLHRFDNVAVIEADIHVHQFRRDIDVFLAFAIVNVDAVGMVYKERLIIFMGGIRERKQVILSCLFIRRQACARDICICHSKFSVLKCLKF